MATRETIRYPSKMILGYLDHESNGDVVVRNYSGMMIGRYDARSDTTRNYGGQILYYGNMAAALLIMK